MHSGMSDTWSDFSMEMIPSLPLYCVIVIIAASLFLSGALTTPHDCATEEVNSCALFPKSPKTTSGTNTLAWTIPAIVIGALLFMLATPTAGRWLTSMKFGKWLFRFLIFALAVILVVVGGVQVSKAKKDVDSKDNGVTALILGLWLTVASMYSIAVKRMS